MVVAIQAQVIRPVFFFEGVFTSSTLRLWTGYGDFSWDTEIWYGNGWFNGFDGAGETDDLRADGCSILLAGVPQSVISLILGEASQGKPGKLWFGALDDVGALVDTPYLLFSGRLDVPEIDDGAEGASVRITYESELADLEKEEEWRYTDEHQKFWYPGDRGLEFLASLADWSGYWGKPERDSKKRKKKENKQRGKRR